jgi:SAM-dependent methyltransferase
MPVPSNWFEDFFYGITLDLWRQAIPPDQTKAEAEFLIKHLGCTHGAHLLDVPCGNGRLSFELAKRGYRVTGVDLSEEFIKEARSIQANLINPSANADGTDSLASIDFVRGDMRDIKGEAIYDGAFCFGNSFAFLEPADMEIFLHGVARVLKPNARFIVETGMAAESILPKFEAESTNQIGDIIVVTRERYLAEKSCIESEYIFERDGKKETRLAKEWIYTAAESRRMLERAGFSVLEVYGSLQCEPYNLGSQELFVVAAAR